MADEEAKKKEKPMTFASKELLFIFDHNLQLLLLTEQT